MLFSTIAVHLCTALGFAAGAFGAGFNEVNDFAKDSGTVEAKADPPLVSFDSLGNMNLVISLINKYRVAHQAPVVNWNSSLAIYAANAAYPCNFRQSHGPYGEILAGSTTVNNPEWFVWFVYGENTSYNFKNPDVTDPRTKHFTQLVWAGTKQVGCAFASGCPELKYQLWCEFFPKGNAGSQLAYRNNVKPADKTKEIPAMPPTNV
ncbi:hypothetical protein EYR41_010077 [Orbilia oligospora]|uniref:Uncharacterized protein n=1 Tax=Orbilia oligospora TaxID=2813651 RepID=A0A7C8PQ32_ORBOL|nr:hypothetical protein TWF751_006474 [Orbilia oligospora]TGJ63994.1 hypothetical protein EYR41_010077 [Orbilia oligospora]